jgi:hypothetical protein
MERVSMMIEFLPDPLQTGSEFGRGEEPLMVYWLNAN